MTLDNEYLVKKDRVIWYSFSGIKDKTREPRGKKRLTNRIESRYKYTNQNIKLQTFFGLGWSGFLSIKVKINKDLIEINYKIN